MKRIAILTHGLGADGIGTLFANLSGYWDLSEFEVTYFLAVDVSSKQFWEDMVRQNGVRIIHITDLDGRKLYQWPKKLNDAFHKYGPFDAIHVNMDMLNGVNLWVAKKAGIKTRICHAHVSENQVPNNFFKFIIKRVYISIMKQSIKRNSTYKIACSSLAGDYFFGKADYLVIENGIDIEKYQKGNLNSKSYSRKMVFCTVGRIDYPKNPFFIVDVVRELCAIDNSVSFVWVGSGGMASEIKKYVNSLPEKNVIRFLGARDDVENILQRCSYFLFPSKYEGFGLVAVEAQAAGLDCFVSDMVPSDINCGKCKYISLNKSPAMWAKEIMEYIHSDEKMQLDEKKLERFDIKYMAEKLQNIYAKA